MDITIREAEKADLSALAELFDLYRQFYEKEPDYQLALEFLTGRFESGQSVILTADAGREGMVGFCQLYPSFCSVEARPIYVLYDLFVVPVARKLGVGCLLLQAAESRARAEGRARMDLSTARTNLRAQALYESLGWIRDDAFLTYNRKL
jgi:ribosomal protein S18 acetylase RimI-like enzyme